MGVPHIDLQLPTLCWHFTVSYIYIRPPYIISPMIIHDTFLHSCKYLSAGVLSSSAAPHLTCPIRCFALNIHLWQWFHRDDGELWAGLFLVSWVSLKFVCIIFCLSKVNFYTLPLGFCYFSQLLPLLYPRTFPFSKKSCLLHTNFLKNPPS